MTPTDKETKELSRAIVAKAKDLGADLAGIVTVNDLHNAPSFVVAPKIPPVSVGHTSGEVDHGLVRWPEYARSVIVIALAHPEHNQELDWWHGKHSPPGNQKLMTITKKLREWLNNNYSDLETYNAPYYTEKGGIFLKDAAVKAGLGVIGRNNLFLTPEFGPRIRLRAFMTSKKLINPLEIFQFDPCSTCSGYCMKSCPQGAFEEIIYTSESLGHNCLPGITGNYNRFKCNNQMEEDLHKASTQPETTYYEPVGETVELLKYCRLCELSCPVGNNDTNNKGSMFEI